tara:strand:+ start:6 stop:1598 length:1593 start_codon:yes stop_codon:yes gene_type:complete
MALDNIQQIINKYEDMSLEELGSSLLSRQSKISAARQKARDKADRISKIIGGLLATQSIFGNNAKSKIEDINQKLKNEQYTNSTVSKNAMNFAKSFAGMGEQLSKGTTWEDLAEEYTTKFTNNNTDFFQPEIDNYYNSRTPEEKAIFDANNYRQDMLNQMSEVLWKTMTTAKDGDKPRAIKILEEGGDIVGEVEGQDYSKILDALIGADEGFLQKRRLDIATDRTNQIKRENTLVNGVRNAPKVISDVVGMVFGRDTADNMFSDEQYRSFEQDDLETLNYQGITTQAVNEVLSKNYSNVDEKEIVSQKYGSVISRMNTAIQEIYSDYAKTKWEDMNFYLNYKGTELLKNNIEKLVQDSAGGDPTLVLSSNPVLKRIVDEFGVSMEKANQPKIAKQLAEELEKENLFSFDKEKFLTDQAYREKIMLVNVIQESGIRERKFLERGEGDLVAEFEGSPVNIYFDVIGEEGKLNLKITDRYVNLAPKLKKIYLFNTLKELKMDRAQAENAIIFMQKQGHLTGDIEELINEYITG